MAEIHWLEPVNGNWDKASDWSGGVVPGASDDVFLDASETADYTVKVTGFQPVNTLQIASNATLDIGDAKAACGFDATHGLSNAGSIVVGKGSFLDSGGGGSGNLTNTGTIVAKNGGNLRLNNVINNSGMIEVESKSLLTASGFSAAYTGGGTIDLVKASIQGGDGKKNTLGYLTNVDNLIEGSGVIGGTSHGGHNGRRLSFTNEAAGVVDANATSALILETGEQTITNAGLIEATSGGVCIIKSAVSNTGMLEANGGTLKLDGAVTGSGTVAVAAGSVVITNIHAREAVTFTGQGGTLELDQSQTYSGDVAGFSMTGQTTLDLRDIGFVSPNEATFSGTAKSGVLTVTDGTHTARIHLVGDYTGSTFVASGDGNGGVDIVDPSAQAPSAAHFVGAMAMLGGHGGSAGGLIDGRAIHDGHPLFMAGPRVSIA
jgi:hypothetical protein